MKKTTTVTGNTFPFREELKALGAKWDAARKAWTVEGNLTMRERAALSSLIHRMRQAGCKIS